MIFTRFAAVLKAVLVVRLLRQSWDDSRIGSNIASLSHFVKATIDKPVKAGSAKDALITGLNKRFKEALHIHHDRFRRLRRFRRVC
jgi:hypothetical protein